MAHGEHQGSSAAAVERSSQRGLEGQGLVPLDAAASPSSRIHQVRGRMHCVYGQLCNIMYIFGADGNKISVLISVKARIQPIKSI